MYPEKKEELESMITKYPDVTPFVILKQSVRLHGASLTDKALDRLQGSVYSYSSTQNLHTEHEIQQTGRALPGPIILRDGSTAAVSFEEEFANPYLVDWDGENFILLDGDEFIDTIDFVPRPQYVGKKTSRGVPMETIAEARTQYMFITTYAHCHLWDTGEQCRYCMFFTDTKGLRQEISRSGLEKIKKNSAVDPEDIYETVKEALKERGRFSGIHFTAGMDYNGEELFDDEVNRYIDAIRAAGRNFRARFPSFLTAPAYSKKQLKRIHDETLLSAYAAHIEVWDERISKWICPGKNKFPGREEWIRRTFDAVEIFGVGNVYSQIVAGVELARPHGFKTIDEALDSNFRACEYYAKNGVIFVATFWRPHKFSTLGKQPSPPLEYYVRLARGLHDIRKSYGLSADQDDYKHCSNHADTDMERAD
jgi:hypothetical protein